MGEEERKNQILALVAAYLQEQEAAITQSTKEPPPDPKVPPPGEPTDEKPPEDKATEAQAEADGAFTVAMGPPAPDTVLQVNGRDAQELTFWNGEEVSRKAVE